MDHGKLLDVLTSLPVSRSILPRAVCFATSHPANHAICSFIDSSGYASGPIRRCLFIDYIIIVLSLHFVEYRYIANLGCRDDMKKRQNDKISNFSYYICTTEIVGYK